MVRHFSDLKTGSNVFRFLKEHLKTVHLTLFYGIYIYIFVFQICAKKRLFTVLHENFINEEVEIKDPETLRDVLLVMKMRSFFFVIVCRGAEGKMGPRERWAPLDIFLMIRF